MSTLVVDCENITAEADFWELYVSVAKPQGAHFVGRNLDAFWDAISGGGPGFPREDRVHFINLSGVRLIGGGTFYFKLSQLAQQSQGAVLLE